MMEVQVATSVPFIFTPASYKDWDIHTRQIDMIDWCIGYYLLTHETESQNNNNLNVISSMHNKIWTTHSGIIINLLIVDHIGRLISFRL